MQLIYTRLILVTGHLSLWPKINESLQIYLDPIFEAIIAG